MNKTLIAAAVLAASALTSHVVTASSTGTINFTGNILKDGCDISSQTANQSITMDDISTNAFSAVGSTAGSKAFKLVLSNCPNGTAAVSFDGISATDDDTVLALTGAGTKDVAAGVGIQITDEKGTVVSLHQASPTKDVVSGNAELKFIARYYATELPVTVGTANAVTNFTIVYP